MGKIKPIRPEQVVEAMKDSLPDYLIHAINQLIAEKWTGNSATFKVSELKKRINENRAPETLEITNPPLNFEPVFEKEGWEIACDRPAYNEAYETNWTFKQKR